MSEIPSKPTIYKNIRFKSRIEAKAAVLFDELGLKWEYEPFQEDGYSVDFILKNDVIYQTLGGEVVRGDLYVEVKGRMASSNGYKADWEKIQDFVNQGRPLLIFNYIPTQYLKDWGSFRGGICDIYQKEIEGLNPNHLCAFNSEMIDGAYNPAILCLNNEGGVTLADIVLEDYMPDIDKEKTLQAYRTAFNYIFNDPKTINVSMNEVEELKKEKYELKRHNRYLKWLFQDKKTERLELRMCTTMKNKLTEIADAYGIRLNRLLLMVIWDYIEKAVYQDADS